MVSKESIRIWRERRVAELKAKGMTDIVEEDGRVWFTTPKGVREVWLHGYTSSMPKEIWEEMEAKRRTTWGN